MRKIIIATLLLATLVARGQSNTDKTPTNSNKVAGGWKTYNGTNYSVQYPPNWELNTNGQMGTSFIFFSPLENDKDQFKENVNLLVQDLRGSNIDLNKFVEISEEQVKTMITNSTLEESSRVKSSKHEYHKMIYIGDQSIYRLKFEQYFWIVSQQAYVLTFTCEQTKFSEYKEAGERILNSFSFNK